jgi:hypothetical protein
MKVGLDEMYKGSVRKLQMTRSVKCDKCSGSGSKSGKRYTCEVRGGQYTELLCGKQTPGVVIMVQPGSAGEEICLRQCTVVVWLSQPQPHDVMCTRLLSHQPRFACRPALTTPADLPRQRR